MTALWVPLRALVSTLLLWAVVSPSASAADENLVYVVQPGDTLISIAERLLDPPEDWRSLQRLIGLDDPRRLQPNTELRIPQAWLKGQPAQATVAAVSGEATVDGKAIEVGARLTQDATLRTGADGVVVLLLPDRTRLRIAPASLVRFERLRSYHPPEVIDARMRLERGSIESEAATQRKRPLEIRTPHATAAVRGTSFRVSTDDTLARDEVLAGSVAWGSEGRSVTVPAGYGSTADRTGTPTPPETLLPAPALQGLPASVAQARPALTFPAVAGARTYSVEIARDPAFQIQHSRYVTDQPVITFEARQPGSYHFRVRGIAASRLEGLDAFASVTVLASVAPRPSVGVLAGDGQPVQTGAGSTVRSPDY